MWQLANILDNIEMLRAGIDAIHKKAPISYTFEWMFNEIYTGKLGFYKINATDFIIVRKDYNGRTAESVLFVVCAYSRASSGLNHYRAATLCLAADLRCSSIQFTSPRKGYKKLAWATEKEVIYEWGVKELSHNLGKEADDDRSRVHITV